MAEEQLIPTQGGSSSSSTNDSTGTTATISSPSAQDASTSKSTDTTVTSSQGSTGYDEGTTTAADATHAHDASTDTSQGKSDTAKRQEEGKMSALERERNELNQKLKAAEDKAKIVDALDQLYRKSSRGRKAYEELREAYRDATGEDIGSYDDVYGQATTQPTTAPTGAVGAPSTNDQVVHAVQAYLSAERAANKFFEQRPKMNPATMNDEQKREAAVIWNTITPIAQAMKMRYPEMDDADLLTAAYDSLPEHQNQRIENAQQKGELIGRAIANGQFAGQESAAGGTGTAATGAGGFDPAQLSGPYRRHYDHLVETKGKEFADRYGKRALAES